MATMRSGSAALQRAHPDSDGAPSGSVTESSLQSSSSVSVSDYGQTFDSSHICSSGSRGGSGALDDKDASRSGSGSCPPPTASSSSETVGSSEGPQVVRSSLEALTSATLDGMAVPSAFIPMKSDGLNSKNKDKSNAQQRSTEQAKVLGRLAPRDGGERRGGPEEALEKHWHTRLMLLPSKHRHAITYYLEQYQTFKLVRRFGGSTPPFLLGINERWQGLGEAREVDLSVLILVVDSLHYFAHYVRGPESSGFWAS